MNNNITNYMIKKIVESIMFDLNFKDYNEAPNLFDITIMYGLKDLVKFYTHNNCLSKEVISNVQKYLMEARLFKDENREHRNNIINDIITLLNTQKKDESILFYRIELYQRTNDYKFLTKYSDELIKSNINKVHNYICNDLIILNGHLDITSNDVFICSYLPKYLKDEKLYYQSILKILKENPFVFKDETFYARVIYILDNYMCDNKYQLKSNEKIKKRIKKIKTSDSC